MAISLMDFSPDAVQSFYTTIDSSIKYIELRLDLFDFSSYDTFADAMISLDRIVASSPRRIILTYRTVAQ